MASVTKHLKTFSELSERVIALGDSIKKVERDMKSVWMDRIEEIDLRDVKAHMKAVEDALRLLGKEVAHIEAEHCKEAKPKYGKN